MAACLHEKLEPIGEQKTDGGVNSYLRCRSCGALLVATPERKVHVLKPVEHAQD